MDYCTWATEYKNTADELTQVIKRLNAQKKRALKYERSAIERRLKIYRASRNECMEIAETLLRRGRRYGI